MLTRSLTLTEQVAGQVADAIANGDYPVGERLPTGKALAQLYGVSAAVIREATERLRAQGLVESRQGAGCTVVSRTARPGFQVPGSGDLDRDQLRGVYELRMELEGGAAALAARRRTEADLRAMRGHLDALEQSLYHPVDGVEHDLAFHVAVASATGNPYYRSLLQYLNLQLRSAVQAARDHTLQSLPGQPETVHREHLAVFEAVRAGDPAAARRAAVAHLRGASARLGLDLAPPSAVSDSPFPLDELSRHE